MIVRYHAINVLQEGHRRLAVASDKVLQAIIPVSAVGKRDITAGTKAVEVHALVVYSEACMQSLS